MRQRAPGQLLLHPSESGLQPAAPAAAACKLRCQLRCHTAVSADPPKPAGLSRSQIALVNGHEGSRTWLHAPAQNTEQGGLVGQWPMVWPARPTHVHALAAWRAGALLVGVVARYQLATFEQCRMPYQATPKIAQAQKLAYAEHSEHAALPAASPPAPGSLGSWGTIQQPAGGRNVTAGARHAPPEAPAILAAQLLHPSAAYQGQQRALLPG
jgi:hypothetical protein